MEISSTVIVLGILYHFLGIQGFRIGNNHHALTKTQLQLDNISASRWKKLFSRPIEYINNYDRKKRFFEFNPVAFKKEPLKIPEAEEPRNQFLFSPLISSIERLKAYTQRKPVRKFKSTYISSAEKPKHLKPYVDHFSGVKSFSLHLNNQVRTNSLGATIENVTIQGIVRPGSGISMRAFLEPNKDQFTEKDIQSKTGKTNSHSLHASWNGVPVFKETKDGSMNEFDFSLAQADNEPHAFEYERQPGGKLLNNKVSMFSQDDRNKHNNIIQTGLETSNGTEKLNSNEFIQLQSVESPDLINSKGYEYKSESKPDELDYSKASGHFKESESNPFFGLDLDLTDKVPALDKGFESFTFEPDELETWGTENVDSDVANDFEFGSFGNIINDNENSIDQPVGGFDHYKETGSKPYFGIEYMPPDGYQTFEQGFGSFSSDTSNCEDIETRACMGNSDCSCYGLYLCSTGKCVSTAELAPAIPSEQTEIGQWDEEPVDFDSWKK